MSKTVQLLSGNEAIALGAYHAGVQVATAYPGTPSTEILENLSRFNDIYAEWSTNEKVAMEVAMGAAYTGARAMVSMKHVGLNVASDPFMAASSTSLSLMSPPCGYILQRLSAREIWILLILPRVKLS